MVTAGRNSKIFGGKKRVLENIKSFQSGGTRYQASSFFPNIQFPQFNTHKQENHKDLTSRRPAGDESPFDPLPQTRDFASLMESLPSTSRPFRSR